MLRGWPQRGALILLVACASWALAHSFSGESDTSGLPATRVEVKRVRSGSSVKLETDEKLVYAGIRAPGENEPLFEESRRRNAELVDGREVRVRYDKSRQDPKGRLTGYVFADGQFVNETLVREGLAYVRLTPESRRFADTLLDAQSEARRDRRGLWALPEQASEDNYPADPKYGSFHRPTCAEVPKIKPERRHTFTGRSAALDEGLAPCNRCLP